MYVNESLVLGLCCDSTSADNNLLLFYIPKLSLQSVELINYFFELSRYFEELFLSTKAYEFLMVGLHFLPRAHTQTHTDTHTHTHTHTHSIFS